jgi:thiamine phosphate synthase YjbQ (UPF0047 family)
LGETIPVIEGKLGLSRWQNIFFCEFGGPRSTRSVVVKVGLAPPGTWSPIHA